MHKSSWKNRARKYNSLCISKSDKCGGVIPFPPKALHPQPQGWCTGKLRSLSLPQALCYPGIFPRTADCPGLLWQPRKTTPKFFLQCHPLHIPEHWALTVVFSPGKAQCWCNNTNSWALTWQCLNLNASLILGNSRHVFLCKPPSSRSLLQGPLSWAEGTPPRL